MGLGDFGCGGVMLDGVGLGGICRVGWVWWSDVGWVWLGHMRCDAVWWGDVGWD